MGDTPLFETWDRLGTIFAPFMVRCGTAALCGTLIGLERELKGKAAGLRTNILICLGSSIYMASGVLLAGDAGETGSDPARIAAQVVTGIGFLGAGCIIQDRGRVTGLTTAATIWVVAAIGILAGAGFPILALVSSTLVLVTLALFRRLERKVLAAARPDRRREADRDERERRR